MRDADLGDTETWGRRRLPIYALTYIVLYFPYVELDYYLMLSDTAVPVISVFPENTREKGDRPNPT